MCSSQANEAHRDPEPHEEPTDHDELGEGNSYYASSKPNKKSNQRVNHPHFENKDGWGQREKKDFWGQPFELSP